MYKGSKFCSLRELCNQVVRGKIRELNSQKNIKAVTKRDEPRIGVVDLSDIRSIGKSNVELGEEAHDEGRV